MTELDKLFKGITSIDEYDLDYDFNDDEIELLLKYGFIKASDIGAARAYELLLDGIIDCRDFPFEKFPHYEQIRLLEYCIVEPEEFLFSADLKNYSESEWLDLLDVMPYMAEIAPWTERLRARAKSDAPAQERESVELINVLFYDQSLYKNSNRKKQNDWTKLAA